MDIEGFTTQEFHALAMKIGLTAGQIKRLKENRLFPRTERVSPGGWGKGHRFYYPPESVDALKSLLYWRGERGTRYLEDLRWYLWLYGDGWDWLWEDVRKDLQDMLPGDRNSDETPPSLEGTFFGGRYRLSRQKRTRESFRMALPWLVETLLAPMVLSENRHIGDVDLGNKPPVAEIDTVFGSGSYNLVERSLALKIYSYEEWWKALKFSGMEDAAAIKPMVREFETAWNENEEFLVLRKILGQRPLRGWGLHRLPRLVLVCTLLLLQVDPAVAAERD
jgi:hypothetical protein